MAGALIPYANAAMSRFSPVFESMIRRGIPIAQQRVMGLLGGPKPAAGPGMMSGRFVANNPHMPMAMTAPPAAVIASQAGGWRRQAPPPALTMPDFAQNIGPVGRARATSGAGGALDGITPDMIRNTVGSDPYADEIRFGNDLGLYYGPGGNNYNADQPDIQPPPAIDPVADALGIGVGPASNRAMARNRDADVPLPPPRPSEEEIKKLRAMQAYTNNYQSNSLPVLNEGKINWGTDATGYDGGDSYGGNAADFLRADALRRAVPGLLGM